jgi:hypothetical protein
MPRPIAGLIEQGEPPMGGKRHLSINGQFLPEGTAGPRATAPVASPPATLPLVPLAPPARESSIARATRSPHREPYRCATIVTTLDDENRHQGSTRAIDLLPDGIRMTLDGPLAEGTRVKAEVVMPNTLFLVGRGVVHRCTPLGTASFLVQISFEGSSVLVDSSQENAWPI